MSKDFGKNQKGKSEGSNGKKNYGQKPQGNKKNTKPNGNNQRGNQQNDYYSGAPYNFVSFYNDVVSVAKEDMDVRDRIGQDYVSGEISYQFTAETPVFIDDGTEKHDFTRNEYHEYAIPGSSVRGLLRSNAQILGLSSFDQDIDDYDLMYRNVAGGAEKSRYMKILGAKQISITPNGKPVGVLTNVQAGYLEKSGKGYVIYKTKVEKLSANLNCMNYYVLSERTVVEDLKKGKDNFSYFKSHPERMQHKNNCAFVRYEDKNGRIHYRGVENPKYQPDYYPVFYSVKNIKNVAGVSAVSKGEISKKGTLIGTGNMKEKKVQYIIPEIDKTKEPISIPEEDVKAFQIDFEKKKNTLKRFKNVEFFNLPKEGESKPVFYIFLDGRLYFGFTPRLRLFYDSSIKKGYHQRKVEFDYAKSIFGCTGDHSYKSKVSFTDAKAYKVSKDSEFKIILGEPKPTSYLDYLKQTNGGITTYNNEDFELRGVKQYWLRKAPAMLDKEIANEDVSSKLKPMDKGTIFVGKIRFQSLTRFELGLLLWALKLEKNSWMNIGKGKPYGFGAISVSDIRVRLVDYEQAYSLTGLSFDPFKEEDVDSLIQVYKKKISEHIGKEIDQLESIQEFFKMKDATKLLDEKKIRYMELEKKEYQNRKKPLPTVSQLVKN